MKPLTKNKEQIMRLAKLILVGLFALVALIISLPGVVLAVAELAVSRNLTWGPVLLATHLTAFLCALTWGVSVFARRRVGHWGWVLAYLFAFALGLAAIDNMHFRFMM